MNDEQSAAYWQQRAYEQEARADNLAERLEIEGTVVLRVRDLEREVAELRVALQGAIDALAGLRAFVFNRPLPKPPGKPGRPKAKPPEIVIPQLVPTKEEASDDQDDDEA